MGNGGSIGLSGSTGVSGRGGERLLGDDDGEDAVLDVGLDLVGPHVLRQHEFPVELPFPPLGDVPHRVLGLLLFRRRPLPLDAEDVPLLELDLDVLPPVPYIIEISKSPRGRELEKKQGEARKPDWIADGGSKAAFFLSVQP